MDLTLTFLLATVHAGEIKLNEPESLFGFSTEKKPNKKWPGHQWVLASNVARSL